MTIVLLPGMDGALELRGELLSRLSSHYQVLGVPLPASTANYSEVASLVVPRLPAGRLVLIGESYSGPLAIELASRLSDRIAGLVLVATFARAPLPAFIGKLTSTVDHRAIPARVRDFFLFGHTGTRQQRAALHAAAMALDPDVAAQRVRAALKADARAELRALACPVLCLHGQFDRLIRPSLALEIAGINRRVQLRFLPAAHMLLETHAAEAAAEIAAFRNSLA